MARRPFAEDDNHDVMRNVICGTGNIDVLSVNMDISEHQEYRLSHPLRMLSRNLAAMRYYRDEMSSMYVISDIFGQCVKIGEAKDINKRLLQLQAGNPRRLYVHRAFWFQNKQYAQFVENQSHHGAKDRGFERLQSEWFRCSPSEAHNLILSTIDFLRISSFGVATPGTAHWELEQKVAA